MVFGGGEAAVPWVAAASPLQGRGPPPAYWLDQDQGQRQTDTSAQALKHQTGQTDRLFNQLNSAVYILGLLKLPSTFGYVGKWI